LKIKEFVISKVSWSLLKKINWQSTKNRRELTLHINILFSSSHICILT